MTLIILTNRLNSYLVQLQIQLARFTQRYIAPFLSKLLLCYILILVNNQVFSQHTDKIEYLKSFTKAYGYVKYFHPTDEASQIDWGKFSAYGASEIGKCSSQEEVLSTLDILFSPIAPSIVFIKSENRSDYDLKQITPDRIKKYQVTYWQHNGVSLGMNEQKGVYTSSRLHRLSSIKQTKPFGNVMTIIDAKQFQGKEFKYTGWVKVDKKSKGTGHLWFRVDKSDNSMGFFDNMAGRPIRDSGWVQYEVVGTVDSMAAKLAFGCFLDGYGELWVDDLQLFFKESGKWEELHISNSDFESEEVQKKIDKTQWVKRVVNSEVSLSTSEFKEGLKSISIESKDRPAGKKGRKLFNLHPEFGEVVDKEIGAGITCQLPLVLYGNKSSTYPGANKIDYDELAEALKDLRMSPTNLSTRLGNVINVFNVFQHFYPYFDVVEVSWENELEKALERCYTDQTIYDHLVTLEKFTGTLRDGHVNVSSSASQRYLPPLEWEWIENKLVVTRVYEEDKRVNVGDVVTEINSESPVDFFTEVYSRISAATKGSLDYKAKRKSLLGDEGAVLSLVIEGKPLEVKREKKHYRKRNSPSETREAYKQLSDSIFYVNLDIINMGTFKELMSKLDENRAIIFDLRGYPNDNHRVIFHLMNYKDSAKGWMQIPQIIYPDHDSVMRFEKHDWIGLVKSKKPYLGDKKIVFIIDGRAISYAESFMGYIEGYDLATIVGQPTAGTNGNVNAFDLPGGYSIRWTGMKVVKHDGSQHHGIGILPDVYVTKTIRGLLEGRDEFLDKAIEIAKER